LCGASQGSPIDAKEFVAVRQAYYADMLMPKVPIPKDCKCIVEKMLARRHSRSVYALLQGSAPIAPVLEIALAGKARGNTAIAFS
jgi:hypothetical protein